MRYFIGSVPREFTERTFEDYFRKFGDIEEITLKGSYGFVSFYDEPVGMNLREHVYRGNSFVVEKARIQNDRQKRRYDQRYNRPELYGARCICDQCPLHGQRMPVLLPPQRMMRERDRLKVVCENVNSNPSDEELRQFANKNKIHPVYIKLTRNSCVIFEFETIEEKDDAMKLLDGMEFNGDCIKTRSFMAAKSMVQREDSYKRRKDSTEQEIKAEEFYEDSLPKQEEVDPEE